MTAKDELVAKLRDLARGEKGRDFRERLLQRYLIAYRSANGMTRLPNVSYLNGWWKFGFARYRTEKFIRMMLLLEERAKLQGTELRREGE